MPVNRLKTTYQRNLLIGTLSAALITIVVCGLLYLDQEPLRTVKISPEKIIFTDLEFKIAGQGMAESDNYGNYNGVHHGFNLPDKTPMASGRPDPFPASFENVARPAVFENIAGRISFVNEKEIHGFPSSLQNPVDDHYGYAVPNDSRPRFGGNSYPLKVKSPGNPDHPLWISGLKVEHPFNPTGLVDTVVVLLTIDKEGRILNIETVYDALPQMGFARQFHRALYSARIYPARVNGNPVGGTYPIWCIFERSSARERIKNSPNITISSSH